MVEKKIDEFDTLVKALSHLATAIRFYRDEKKSDTDQEIKCCIRELDKLVDGVKVEFG